MRALAGVVLEGLADDAPGQLDREPADLGPQLEHRLLAVGLDGGASRLEDRGRPRYGPRPVAASMISAPLRLSLLANARGVAAQLGQLGLVLLPSQRGLGLSLVGLGDAALDRLCPLGEGLLEDREDLPLEERGRAGRTRRCR